MIRVDASEIKTYRECKRKHLYSSRNRFHLISKVPNDNLVFGTQFHEILAMMYLGTSLDKILEWITREIKDPVYYKTAQAMTTGYYNEVYSKDKDRFVVVDIEKKFCFPIGCRDVDGNVYGLDSENITYGREEDGSWTAVDMSDGQVLTAICACGSIDMICLDAKTGEMCGFEHKTAKNFRPEVYDLVDEQPRLYSWALRQILEEYHLAGKYTEVTDVGPIYLNQVRKLQRNFDTFRSACKYKDEDLKLFLKSVLRTMTSISCEDASVATPEPGFMKCQMCDYADLCMHYGYATPTLEGIQDEFEGEFEVREVDHLDEKTSRHNEEADE